MRKYIVKMLLATGVLFLLFLAYCVYEGYNIKEVNCVFEHDNVPDSFVGKKIVFISDIHSNRFFTSKNVKSVVDMVNKKDPDIIILGGDNVKKDPKIYEPFFEELKNLKARYGVYTVLGNHDHWENPELIREKLLECGFNECDNKSYWVKIGNDSIKIGGVGDLWEDDQILENTIHDVKDGDFCILLSHNPDYAELLNTDKVNLMLSGHTHAGQITFFGLWAPILPATFHSDKPQTGQKYRYGWKKKDDFDIYITSGVGVGDLPFRFFAQPEIVEIILER